jgi:hypothetical protein
MQQPREDEAAFAIESLAYRLERWAEDLSPRERLVLRVLLLSAAEPRHLWGLRPTEEYLTQDETALLDLLKSRSERDNELPGPDC